MMTRGEHRRRASLEAPGTSNEEDLWSAVKNVMSFSLARSDPWLEGFEDVFAEDLAMMSVSGEGECSKTAWWFKKLFALSCLDLVEDRRGGPKNRVQITIASPGGNSRHQLLSADAADRACSHQCWRRNLLVLAVLALISCLALAGIVSCILLYRHDSCVLEMRPTLANSNLKQRTKRTADDLILCALREDIVHGVKFSVRDYDAINWWMDRLGISNRAQLGLVFLSTTVVVCGALIFFCLPLLFFHNRGRGIRLDSVACILSPALERRRITTELERVIRDIMASVDKANREDRRLVKLNRYLRQMDSQRAFDHEKTAFSCGGTPPEEAREGTRVRPRLLSNAEKVRFLNVLNEIRVRQQTRPIVICSKWHLDMHRYARFLIILFLLISSALPQVSTLGSYVLELYIHTLERLKQYECQSWHPNATIFKPSFQLVKPGQEGRPLFLSQAEQEAYEAYDSQSGGLPCVLYLMFVYEARHMIDLRVFFFYLGLITLVELLSICSVLWTSTFMVSFYDKIAWIVQVRAQIEWCCKQLRAQHSATELARGSEGGLNLELLVEKRLTIAYINYELFRRQYKSFRQLTTFLVIQTITFSAGSFLALYMIVTRRENKFRIMSILVSLCVVATLNIYLVVASYASKLVEGLMLDLIRLLAHLARYPRLLTGPTMNLWRRQLISKHEVHLFGNTKILAMVISYQKILSLNVQLIGMWLLLLRVFHSKNAGSKAAEATESFFY